MFLISKLFDHKKSLNLPDPGKVEDLHKPAKNVLPSQFIFDGLRFTLGKGLSQNFQMMHQFNLGSKTNPSSYGLSSVFAHSSDEKEEPSLIMHGMVDFNGTTNGLFKYALNKICSTTIKLHTEGKHKQFHSEIEFKGSDSNLVLTSVNSLPPEQSNVLQASIIQSITDRLCVGVDLVRQNFVLPNDATNSINQNLYSLHLRYKFNRVNHIADEDIEQPITDPLFTVSVSSYGGVQASYLHPVSKKVELASDFSLYSSGVHGTGAIASVGAKYDFVSSTLRIMVDSVGKVSSYWEQRLSPNMVFLLSGEIDHYQNQSRFGFGLQLDV